MQKDEEGLLCEATWLDDDPISKLRTIWNEYEPQMSDYITRAINPEAAPSYGVPGDL